MGEEQKGTWQEMLARNRAERGEVAQLDPEPLIRLSDSCHENLDLS